MGFTPTATANVTHTRASLCYQIEPSRDSCPWPCYYNTVLAQTPKWAPPHVSHSEKPGCRLHTGLSTADTCVLPSCHLTYRWKAGPGHSQQPGSQRSKVHYLWWDDNNQGFLVYLSAIALTPGAPIGSGSWLRVQVCVVEFEPLPQESSMGLVKRTERTSANC